MKYIWMVFSMVAYSQQPLVGLVQGTIMDQKRAPIPFASLTAINIDAIDAESGRRTSGTNEQGIYQIVNVPTGRYSIVVTKKGYQDYKVPLVRVRPGETVNMPEIRMSATGRHP